MSPLDKYASGAPVLSVSVPRKVAEINICGAIHLEITDDMNYIPPTEEQRRNLKELLCIDVIPITD